MEHSSHVFGSVPHQTPSERKSELFLTSGVCSDELVLLFDDGNKLYVSENFLSYASPVFRAMFEHQFKERETREVEMKEKSFEDFHEFLLCLHPGKQKPIDQNNVLRIVDLAEEYIVEGAAKRCQEVMHEWLGEHTADDTAHLKTCLQILQKAVACSYNELITHAIKTIAKFRHKMFTGPNDQRFNDMRFHNSQTFKFGTQVLPSQFSGLPTSYASSAQYPVTIEKDCKELFEGLPEKVKTNILLERLRICDK